jgi:hypothetical protein
VHYFLLPTGDFTLRRPISLLVLQNHVQKAAHGFVRLQWVTQRATFVDQVVIAPLFTLLRQHAHVLELGDDSLDSALGNPDLLGDIPQACRRILRKRDQNVGIVTEKRP